MKPRRVFTKVAGAAPLERKPLETPPLTRAGRKEAEAVMAATQFKPTVDGKRLVRRYEVHGIVVTEWVNAVLEEPEVLREPR